MLISKIDNSVPPEFVKPCIIPIIIKIILLAFNDKFLEISEIFFLPILQIQ